MRVLLLASLLALPASAATVPAANMPVYTPHPSSQVRSCPPTAAQRAADWVDKGQGPVFHKLTELPPANAYAAVYRQVDGCEAPVVIRYDVTNSKGAAQK